jgi:mycothiol system anti-sigma-R factor
MADAETDCRTVLNKLYLYLDGEISGEEFQVVAVHLEECVSCYGHYGFEKDFKELIHKKCHESRVPEGLAERIRVNIRRVLDD